MARHWSAPLLVNLLLGIPAVVPVWLLWYLAANWPLAELGLTAREPTENDGVLPWFLVAGPVVAVFGLLWWSANRSLRRRTALPPGRYWALGVLATLVPTLALIVVSVM
ncbi:hypothetical protein ABTX60_12815 [Streptomyces sp. NPDC126510]|uniref:hypothetical protein n=1 Tax=Streptomyces sp. NPDC126510 TaxID=3155317 RepID=UPI003327480F